ncbi:MAG: thioredoxin domain-containing protein [Anaerolineae bacterium]|nr:thioredoxin domain-containing protein [Anaerolineae bacterium]
MTQRQQQLIGAVALTAAIVALIVVALVIDPLSDAVVITEPGDEYTGLARRQTTDGAPLLGAPNAPVTVVYFVDFACPHCGNYWGTLQTFITDAVRTGTARLELRILAGLNPTGSPLAAQAALCAGEQGALWEMSSALFQMQAEFGRAAFVNNRISAAAENLRLNTSDLLTCLNDDSRFAEALQTNIDLATSLDVISLPAVLLRQGDSRFNPPQWLMLDGEPYRGSVPLGVLGEAVRAITAPGNTVP